MAIQAQNPFAKTLDSAILANELKGHEAAKLAGVTPGAITRWRSGQEIPTNEKYLRALSKELNIPFDVLCVNAFVSKFPFLKTIFKDRPSPQTIDSLTQEERAVVEKVLFMMRHADETTKTIFLDWVESMYQRARKGISGKWVKRVPSKGKRAARASGPKP